MWPNNRSLRVKMVKDEVNVPPTYIYPPIGVMAKMVTRSVSTCIVVYVGADTARRAIIYILSAKI